MNAPDATYFLAIYDMFWQVRLRFLALLFGDAGSSVRRPIEHDPKWLAIDRVAARELWTRALREVNSDPQNVAFFGGMLSSNEAARLAAMTPQERLAELEKAIKALGITKAGRPEAARFDPMETDGSVVDPGFWQWIATSGIASASSKAVVSLAKSATVADLESRAKASLH